MSRLRPLLPQVSILALTAALVFSFAFASTEPALELTVRARQMAFYVDGDDTPNPRLALPADRKIRLTFVNEDRGIAHDLVLPQIDRATGLLPGNGAKETIVFRTPSGALSASYLCSLHPVMMRGEIELR